MNRIMLQLSFVVLASMCLIAQKASVGFDVVSITPQGKEYQASNIRYTCDGNRFLTSGHDMRDVFLRAINFHPFQLSGATPGWFTDRGDTYRIEARTEQTVSASECKKMVLQVFFDRFDLKLHHVTKEFSAYALVQGKSPLKLLPAPANAPAGGVSINKMPVRGVDSVRPLAAWSMKDLAEYLSGLPSLDGRPVIDRTGLPGLYLVHLEFAEFRDSPGTDVPTALREQAGLSLESTKANFDTVVIDHLERPSKN